jgi:outer membrane biogenesis lipoprotein LolB
MNHGSIWQAEQVTVQIIGDFQIALPLGVQIDRHTHPMRFDWMRNGDPAALAFNAIWADLPPKTWSKT